MFARRELAALAARKAVLLRASEANRARWLAHVGPCRNIAFWVDTGREFAAKAGYILDVFTPLLGRWHRSSETAGGFLPKLAQGLALARSVARLWRTFRSPS